MKRFPIFLALILGGFLLMGADGCSSDPNVEGAKLDLRNKDYDRALENLATALEKNPQNAEALELKGRVLQSKAFEINDPEEHARLMEEAVAAYNQAVSIDSTMAEAVKRDLTLAYVNEFQRGVQAFNRGRDNDAEFNNAALYFKVASVIAPDSTGPYVNEAFALMNAGREADAIEPFEKALEKGDTDPDTYTFLANLYLMNDRAADAVTLLEEATSRYPGNAELEAQLLNAYTLAGMMDRALEKYREAVEKDPNNKVYQYNYGSLLLEQERYDEAIEHLKKAVALDDTYANAQYNLGAAYVNKAVDLNKRISDIDDEIRENRDNMSEEEIKAKEDEIDRLAEERRKLFEQAIPPLERAKELFEAEGQDPQDICRVLFQSYVQTNQTEKAEAVQECAGFDD
ncbi:tetratricopeptide repeat protein [Rhodocaloribacter sp.]